MWSKKRMTISYTPRKLKRPSTVFKRRVSTIDKTSNIKVVVRVRPPNERDLTCREVVHVVDQKCLIFDPKEEEDEFYVGGYKQLNRDMLKKRHKNMEFQFDRVYDTSVDNQEVFEGTTQDLIDHLLDGFNCSVFVYGATGAGKTYTMLGSKETPGIAYLTMVQLYQKMELAQTDYKFDLKISYLEVYNETVKDLICPSGPLNIRDDGKDGIIIPGIKTHHVDTAEELFRMLEYGNKNRTQHPTDANAESSRSHAVFQVHLCITHKLSLETKISKLTMIDLAGSERGAATGGKGVRFSEGSNINKSLLALGNCVDALAEGHKHVPYRNSKLTRILKDSLGGNSKTVMIVNVAPSSISYEETFNTLNYATRAKKINNKARKNLLSVDMSACQYKKIIEDLKQRNMILENEIKDLRQGTPQTREGTPQTREENKDIVTKDTTDIERGKKVLQCLYDLEGQYRKDLLTYQMKTKMVDWRIYQKKVISDRFRVFEYMLGASKSSRMDESMNTLKRQRKVYKENVKINQKLLKEKQTLREIALKDIEAKGLMKELEKDIAYFENKMQRDIMTSQANYYKDLLLKQQHELTSSDEIIGQLCKTMDYYYSVLNGSGRIAKQMSDEYLCLVQQLAGVKSVSWEDKSTEYTILRKVMDLSFISAESSTEFPEEDPVSPSLLQCHVVPTPGSLHPCTPIQTPVIGCTNGKTFMDIPEEEELLVSPVLAANADFNKTFTVTPPMQEDVDTACSSNDCSNNTNSLQSRNVTFTADSASSDMVQSVSEINVPEKPKDTPWSNSPLKQGTKVILQNVNVPIKRVLSSTRNNSTNISNLKYKNESTKCATAVLPVKVRPTTGLKVRPVSRISIHFNALSEKNKLPAPPLKGAFDKNCVVDKSKILSPTQCISRQKENSALHVKNLRQAVSPQVNINRSKCMKSGMIPVKRITDNNVPREMVNFSRKISSDCKENSSRQVISKLKKKC